MLKETRCPLSNMINYKKINQSSIDLPVLHTTIMEKSGLLAMYVSVLLLTSLLIVSFVSGFRNSSIHGLLPNLFFVHQIAIKGQSYYFSALQKGFDNHCLILSHAKGLELNFIKES